MSWFDVLMTVRTKEPGELLKEADWKNPDNWAPKYSDVANKYSNFVLNDFISGFKTGKTYTITPEYVNNSALPSYFNFNECMVENGAWVIDSSKQVRFTTTASGGIRTESATFTVEDGYYYVFRTNQNGANLNTFLNRIKSIIITEE